MRAAVVGLLGVWSVGLLLLLTPFALHPSVARLLGQVVYLGMFVCICWGIAGLAPNHPRAALVVLRIALVYATLLACGTVLPI